MIHVRESLNTNAPADRRQGTDLSRDRADYPGQRRIGLNSQISFGVTVKAHYEHDGAIGVSGNQRIELFTRIWAGIGWPGTEPGYLVILGERLDDRYHAIWESQGGLRELGEATIEAKNRFLVENFLVDASDELATAHLRSLDGLSVAPIEHQGPGSSEPFVSEPRETRDLGPTISAVNERLAQYFSSALEHTRGIILDGRLLIHEPNCPILTYTLRQTRDDVVNSPVMRALVWALISMEQTRAEPASCPSSDQASWYTNLPRHR